MVRRMRGMDGRKQAQCGHGRSRKGHGGIGDPESEPVRFCSQGLPGTPRSIIDTGQSFAGTEELAGFAEEGVNAGVGTERCAGVMQDAAVDSGGKGEKGVGFRPGLGQAQFGQDGPDGADAERDVALVDDPGFAKFNRQCGHAALK